MQRESEKKWYIDCSTPKFFSLDVTGACNFKCLHCFNNSGEKMEDELTDEEIIDIAHQIAEFKPEVVCLCGGETMMRGNIVDIVKILVPHVTAVNMVSNGSLFNEEKLIKLKEAGLSTLQISLDGVNEMQHDTFRGVIGSFNKAVESIKLAQKVEFNTLLSFVPNKLNHATFDEYVDFCLGLGVSSVRIMPLIPMGRGSKIDSLLLSPEDYCNLQLKILNYQEKLRGTKQQVEWGDPLDHYMRLPKNTKNGYKSLTYEIKPNGNITVSTYLPIVVGNVRKHSLREYWDNGYADIWSNKQVLDYISRIENLYDINTMEPKPYSGDYYYIELMK